MCSIVSYRKTSQMNTYKTTLTKAAMFVQENAMAIARESVLSEENHPLAREVRNILRESDFTDRAGITESLVKHEVFLRYVGISLAMPLTADEIRAAWAKENKGGEAAWAQLTEDQKLEFASAHTRQHMCGVTAGYKALALMARGYIVGVRDPKMRPQHKGAYMVADGRDEDGYAIFGDSLNELIDEAYQMMLEMPL